MHWFLMKLHLFVVTWNIPNYVGFFTPKTEILRIIQTLMLFHRNSLQLKY